MSKSSCEFVFRSPPGQPEAAALAAALQAPAWVGDVLSSRGVLDLAAARRHLGEDADCICDPDLIPGFSASIEWLSASVSEPNPIGVFGDYDMDGIAGAALLVKGLKQAGFRPEWRLPSRFRNGYGMHVSDIDAFYALGVRKLLTVDTGVSALAELQHAKELGMEVVVLDHHIPPEVLPPAFAILDPHLPGCEYPNKALCGAGLAWKFCRALLKRLGLGDGIDLLEYMALGTLADLVKLTPENRALVRRALRNFQDSKLPGIKLLANEACPPPRVPGAQDVLFRMTPLLNAAGRLGDPDPAMRLLLCEHSSDAFRLLNVLKNTNEERKRVENEVGNAAQDAGGAPSELPPVVVLASKDWHVGVVGIVAARMVGMWNRPVAVLGGEHTGELRASARSVQGFDWHKALMSADDLLVRWGGHPGAAGFSIKPENVPAFQQRMVEAAAAQDYQPRQRMSVKVDAELPLSQLSEMDLEWLNRLEPFGPGAEEPVFLAHGVHLTSPSREIRGGSLQFSVGDSDNSYPVTAFGFAHMASALDHAGSFSLAYTAGWNFFRGRRTLQLMVKGIAFPTTVPAQSPTP